MNNKSKELFPEHLRKIEQIKDNEELIENLLRALKSSEKELDELKSLLNNLYIDELKLEKNSILVIKTDLNVDRESGLIDLIKDVIPDNVYVLLVSNNTNIELFSEEEMNELGWERIS